VAADSVKFELSTPSEVKQGEPVPVTLRLTNASDSTVTVYLQGRPTAFDIEVADETGRLIWRRLEGQVVAAILAVRSLAPGESLVFEDSWPQRDQAGRQVPSGTYAVTGVLPTDAEPIRSRPAELRILSRS
jgi:intracellular proteinase inhibitor BsuPI